MSSTGSLSVVAQAPAADAAGAVAAGVVKVARVDARPDQVSAVQQARAQGSRLEITSDRTQTDTTYADPDGSFTTENAIVPVRVQGDDGTWRPVDYDLVPTADGSYAPKSSPAEVTFSGGGTGPVATVDKGSKQLDLSLGDLPKPTIEGNQASYQLDANTTLVLAATP